MKIKSCLPFLLFPCLLAALFSCADKEPIKIGLASTLSGYLSTSPKHVRNGIILGVEEWNDQGGIDGRPVELIIRDDQFQVEVAKKIDQEFADMGVAVIIGHSASTIALGVLEVVNQNRIPLIATGSLSSALSKKDDYFFRVSTAADKRAAFYAQLAYAELGLRNIALVYDTSNRAFSEAAYTFFRQEYEKMGGSVSSVITFDATGEYDAAGLASQILENDSDGVYFILNAIHSAILCQHVRIVKPEFPIIQSEWGFSSPSFIENGGSAVEGVVSVGVFNSSSTRPEYLRFKEKFEKRFGDPVSGFSVVSYELVQVLRQAFEYDPDPEHIRDSLLAGGTYQGLYGDIVMDQYGDSVHPMFLSKIENRKIITIKELTR